MAVFTLPYDGLITTGTLSTTLRLIVALMRLSTGKSIIILVMSLISSPVSASTTLVPWPLPVVLLIFTNLLFSFILSLFSQLVGDVVPLVGHGPILVGNTW